MYYFLSIVSLSMFVCFLALAFLRAENFAKVQPFFELPKFFGKIKRFFVRIKDKLCNKWKNRKSVIRKRNKAFIASITYSPEKIKMQRDTKFTKDIKFSVIRVI